MSEITIKNLEKRISRLENQSKPNNDYWPTREEMLEIKNKKLEEMNRFLRNENKEITFTTTYRKGGMKFHEMYNSSNLWRFKIFRYIR